MLWEGHKILRNLPLTFDYSTYSQSKGKSLQNFVAFSEYMNFINGCYQLLGCGSICGVGLLNGPGQKLRYQNFFFSTWKKTTLQFQAVQFWTILIPYCQYPLHIMFYEQRFLRLVKFLKNHARKLVFFESLLVA